MARWEVGPPGASVVAFTEEHTVLFKDGCAVGNGGIQEHHGAVAIGEKTVVRKGQSGELDLVVIVGKTSGSADWREASISVAAGRRRPAPLRS